MNLNWPKFRDEPDDDNDNDCPVIEMTPPKDGFKTTAEVLEFVKEFIIKLTKHWAKDFGASNALLIAERCVEFATTLLDVNLMEEARNMAYKEAVKSGKISKADNVDVKVNISAVLASISAYAKGYADGRQEQAVQDAGEIEK